MSANERRNRIARPFAALLLLSSLWALDGLAPDLFPVLSRTGIPGLERQAITFALAALLAATIAVVRREELPGLKSASGWVGVLLLMFALPVLLIAAVQGRVPQLERVAVFSLVPVFAVVLEPHLGGTSHRGNTMLPAAVAAVGGMLCIFPLSVSSSPGAAAATLGVAVAALCAAVGNCLAVRLATTGREVPSAWSYALGSAAVAAVFAAIGMTTEEWVLPRNAAQPGWIAAVDVPALLLLFWLLSRMSAVRMTARFLLAPLITLLAGLALEQPAITTRMILGIVLIGGGAGWLLLANEECVEPEQISIR